jgi:hypothetical protein
MKAFIPYFCLIIIVQLWACASQSDSMTQENNVPKSKTFSKGVPGDVNKETNPRSIDDLATEDEKKGIKNKKDKSKDKALGSSKSSSSIPSEDEIEVLSVISYSNIIEAAVADMPVQGQKVKLMIKNNHKQAMWYLMPVSGEKTMPTNGQFDVNPEANPPFLAKQYGTPESKLIELIYHGKGTQSFRAFYIEAGSSLLFRNYDLGSYKEGEYVPFWAIKNLEVNNETSLEKWLPFSVTSSPDVVIHNTTESGTAKWIDAGENAVFSSSKVKFVQANGIKKHQIPVGVIR